MPTSCPKNEELEALANGQAGSQAARLQDHLTSCHSCRIAYQSLSVETLAIRNSGIVTPTSTAGDFPFLKPPVQPGDLGRLGNYRVLRLLGMGGMGLVFQAQDITLGRPVALKVMRPEQQNDADGWARFQNEMRTLARIKHEHLVTVYHADQEADVIYFAMELLQGESLDAWIQREPKPSMAEILRIARQIASGLAFIHENNLLHRDIKPANLWLETRDERRGERDEEKGVGDTNERDLAPRPTSLAPRVKILDLGLVRAINTDTSLTAPGIIVGTPDYMSPEQARGDAVDARSDLFSLGCVLYLLCTGIKPFEGRTPTAVLMALASHTPAPARSLDQRVPAPMSELIARMLERKPDDRPPSAQFVLQALTKIEAGLHFRAEEPPLPLTPVPESKRKKEKRAKHKELSPESERRASDIRKPKSSAGKIALIAGLIGLACVAFVIGLVVWLKLSSRLPLNPDGPAAAEKVFLADMQDIAREHWPVRFGKKDKKKGFKEDFPPKEAEMRVRVNGILRPKGIFMHPPTPPFEGQQSSLTYRLGKQFKTFEAEVTLNDTPDKLDGPCTFFVYGDGKEMWRSKPVWSQADAQKCKLSVEAFDQLKLATSVAGPPKGAHAVWLDPAVSK